MSSGGGSGDKQMSFSELHRVSENMSPERRKELEDANMSSGAKRMGLHRPLIRKISDDENKPAGKIF